MDHAVAAAQQVSFKEMSHYPLIVFNDFFITDYLNKITTPEPSLDVIISSDPQMHLSYIHREQGVCLAPEQALAGSKEQEELVFLPLEKEVPLILGLFYPLETPASREIFQVMHSLEQAYIKRQHEDPIL